MELKDKNVERINMEMSRCKEALSRRLLRWKNCIRDSFCFSTNSEPLLYASQVWNFRLYVDNVTDNYVLFFAEVKNSFLWRNKPKAEGTEFLSEICLESA